MIATNHTDAIVVKNVSKVFGGFTAVDGISFHVSKGEIYGLLGPNGSGKTTTIRMMLGLLRPTTGTIEVLSESVCDNPERIRFKIGYMSQSFSLYNDLTVIQNLTFYARAYGIGNAELPQRLEQALELAGLTGRRHSTTKDLSGGWRQRLALAASIIHQPELVFLDEPTAGVDPVSRRAFWDLLYRLISLGVTVFVTTHYMDEAEHCHRLAFIRRGKIIATGTPDEMKKNRMRGKLWELTLDKPTEGLRCLRQAKEAGHLDVGEIALYGPLIHLTIPIGMDDSIDQIKKRVEAVLAPESITLLNASQITPSLEDIFIACMM
jgi:ABC-2 type transport system ATP-binding protein